MTLLYSREILTSHLIFLFVTFFIYLYEQHTHVYIFYIFYLKSFIYLALFLKLVIRWEVGGKWNRCKKIVRWFMDMLVNFSYGYFFMVQFWSWFLLPAVLDDCVDRRWRPACQLCVFVNVIAFEVMFVTSDFPEFFKLIYNISLP